MKIGVISDTHYPRRASSLPEIVKTSLAGVQLIIHAGDLAEWRVVEELETLAPVVAVHGNVDSLAIKAKLSRQKIIQVEGCTIGITHGDGTSGTTLKRARRVFKDEKVDCIVFGHSHIPLMQWVEGVFMFNPGSPTDARRQPFPSFGILTVDETIKGEIFYFDDNQLV